MIAAAQSNTVNGVTITPFGTITWYKFNDTLRSTDPTITSLTVANSYTEPINMNLFVVPSMSFVSGTTSGQYIVRAAVRPLLSPQISSQKHQLTLPGPYLPSLWRNSNSNPLLPRSPTRLSRTKIHASYRDNDEFQNCPYIHDLSGRANPGHVNERERPRRCQVGESTKC